MVIQIPIAIMATMPTPEWSFAPFFGGGLAATIIMVAADRYGRSAVRCPWCMGELYWLTNRGTFQRSFSLAHAKFCLHCGKSLDDELPAEAGPGSR